MSFLFFSFFAASSVFTAQPVSADPGPGVECPAPQQPPLS